MKRISTTLKSCCTTTKLLLMPALKHRRKKYAARIGSIVNYCFFGLMIYGLAAIQTPASSAELDLAFGSGGMVISTPSEHHEYVRRVRVQADGKIVTLGQLIERAGGFSIVGSFVTRHNSNGTLDTSFGASGSVVVPNGFHGSGGYFSDLIILPDGKLLATGEREDAAGQISVALYRFNSNGTWDTTFGSSGVLVTQIAGVLSEGRKILRQTDGKIVVVGIAHKPYSGYLFPIVLRYTVGGALDSSFGTDGILQIASILMYEGFSDDIPGVMGEVLIQKDGKLLIAASTGFDFDNTKNFAVLRLMPNGVFDNTFAGGGIVTTDVANLGNYIGGMILQPDGKIVINGHNIYSDFGFLVSSSVVRYRADGSLDSSFGGGVVTMNELPNPTETSRGLASALAIQPNGKILTAGKKNGNFAISRINSDGTPDGLFGNNGVLTTTVGNNPGSDTIFSLAFQPDGKLLAAGSVRDSALVYDLGLVRYLVNSAPFDFDGDRRSDLGVFRPSDRTWYLDRSRSGFSATQFGLPSDKITPADYDGDGRTDIAIFRDGTWWRINSSNSTTDAINFGVAGDIPIPADYTGDGRSELAVYRNGVWWLLDLSNNQASVNNFGLPTDRPVPADYDGDGRTDQAIYRNGEWHLNRSTEGFTIGHLGGSEDTPVVADYDGDGNSDLAVYGEGTWYVNFSSEGPVTFQWGLATDIPAPADYDGDGKADFGVFRDGKWWLNQSTNKISVQQFGLAGDKPLPGALLP